MSASFRNFVIARILLTIPMVLILVTMVFFVMRVLPGDPIRSQLGPKVSEEQAQAIRERLGLNRPLGVQYFEFLWRMVTLDFGNALTQGERPIRDELAELLPATIELTLPAMALTSIVGVFSGAYAADTGSSRPITRFGSSASSVCDPGLFHGTCVPDYLQRAPGPIASGWTYGCAPAA